jgi:putative membrane-bound dehydrogenase-like protein
MLPLLVFLALPQDPLSPQSERASLRIPAGFELELVLSEPHARKVVDVNFDDAGRMWAVTASEYPVDGNEDSRAAELYAAGGRDTVLVVDRPWEGTCTSPRVFADGLAMPMAVLPLEDRAIVQHGSEILALVDDDGDGRADRREVLLSGFGIEDSHLLPHRFFRAPDGWIYMAQGAFNSSLVLDRSGRSTRFDQCKIGRFRIDGSRFEVIGTGLNNIWGMVFDEHGEMLAQEANDLGYGVVPFFHGVTYPGIGEHRFRPYTPVQPPGTTLRFGGTGLSGLAYNGGISRFPAPFERCVVLANPIERKVQAVSWTGRGIDARFEHLPDLITSEDPRFRPIAVHYGPDDSLYIVDWYNPIISHNEVPRTHPDRDKVRTRVWRLRHASQGAPDVRDMSRAEERELLRALGSTSQFRARAAWHQIVDRGLLALVPDLERIVRDSAMPTDTRSLALWSLGGLGRVSSALTCELLATAPACLRRAAVRGLAESMKDPAELLMLSLDPAQDADLEVRCEWWRAIARLSPDEPEAVSRLLERVPAPDERETIVAEQDRVITLKGRSLEVMRERLWIRMGLEGREAALQRWLSLRIAREVEAQALAGLTFGGERGATLLAGALGTSGRVPVSEELALLARHSGSAAVTETLSALLTKPDGAFRVLDALAAAGDASFDAGLRTRLVEVAKASGDARLLVRIASIGALSELAPDVEAIALDSAAPEVRRDALRFLARIRHAAPESYVRIADSCLPGDALQSDALMALCAAQDEESIAAAIERISSLPRFLAQRVMAELALSRLGADALVEALIVGDVEPSLVTPRLIDSIAASGAERAELDQLRDRFGAAAQEVIVLAGGAADALDTNLTLEPPFSIEAWVQVHEGVDNREGVLCAPGRFDFNFAGGRPRLYLGPQRGDVLISRARLEPSRWMHVALVADDGGRLSLYLDGLLDSEADVPDLGRYDGLDVGRTTPGHGRLSMTEVRIWSRERSARELALEYGRRFDGERPEGLLLRVPGDPASLDGGARVESTLDGPPLLSSVAFEARKTRFERYAALAASGDATRGPAVFSKLCANCHTLGGVGESVGPPLDGVASRGIEGLLAAILEPSAAVEAGYRAYRVQLADETALEGLLVRSDDESITLRPTNSGGAQEARKISRTELSGIRAMKLSVMPEGQLESLSDSDAAALLAYLLSR